MLKFCSKYNIINILHFIHAVKKKSFESGKNLKPIPQQLGQPCCKMAPTNDLNFKPSPIHLFTLPHDSKTLRFNVFISEQMLSNGK